jgi:hypothetical protein
MRRRAFMKATLLTLPVARVHAASTVPAPVVLELFTSQGCSSCPPADALLGDLVHRPGVIGLAWHVDYWNSLGWRDPYARTAWTERQQSYAKYLAGEVYTPALVINGTAMVVGSDVAAVNRAIQQAAPPPMAVTLHREASGVVAEIDATRTPVTGLLVTFDPKKETQVGAGENWGRKLVEYRVVRDVMPLSGLVSRLSLPAVAPDRGAVLLLQDASWHVVGAAELLPGRGA